MSKLKHKSCELDGNDVDVYYQTSDFERGDHLTPSFSACMIICIVELNGVEIGTTEEQEKKLIEQILN